MSLDVGKVKHYCSNITKDTANNIGCHIDNLCVTHVMIAEDFCFMAQGIAALQLLIIHISFDYSVRK